MSTVVMGEALRRLTAASALSVAPRLLGATVTSTGPEGTVSIRLTEVEAYGGVGTDPGSHAYRGRTARNATMFGPPGHWYVYFTYGMHWCLNLVCEPEGTAGAVLLRAGEVTTGAPLAHRRRTRPGRPAPPARDLARGPARLTQALGVDRAHDGVDACQADAPLTLTLPPAAVADTGARTVPDAAVCAPAGPDPLTPPFATGPRVGVSGPGADHPWRFWIPGEPTVSDYRAHLPRRHAGR
jgi:DNA-3-methyladenine glycosylase